MNLRQGECKRQQQDADDRVVDIFASEVRHLGNSCWSTSIDVVNTESTSPRPAVETELWFHVVVVQFESISFPRDQISQEQHQTKDLQKS